MNIYECQICNFSTHIKRNYNRHLNTKKTLTQNVQTDKKRPK